MDTLWHELKPGCYGIQDILQFSFCKAFCKAFSGLPYLEWDPIPEYIGMANRKEYALARKIAWIMAAGIATRGG